MSAVTYPVKEKDKIKELPPALEEAIRRGEEAKKRFLSKEGGTLSIREACYKLNCEPQYLAQMRENGHLIGIEVDDQYVYPAWQFVDGKILPGLDQVLSELKQDGIWTVMIFMLTGDLRLDGKTPLEMLRQGEIEQVIWAASCYGEHSAA